jgi:hypothetical protein
MPKPPKDTPPKRTRHRSHRGAGPKDIGIMPSFAPMGFADMGPMGLAIQNIFQSIPPEKLRELFPKVRAMMNNDAFRDSLIAISESAHQLQDAQHAMFSVALEIFTSLDNKHA